MPQASRSRGSHLSRRKRPQPSPTGAPLPDEPEEVNTHTMRLLLHETARLIKVLPLEVRVRWHGWRAVRHHDLRTRHAFALDRAMGDTRELLASR